MDVPIIRPVNLTARREDTPRSHRFCSPLRDKNSLLLTLLTLLSLISLARAEWIECDTIGYSPPYIGRNYGFVNKSNFPGYVAMAYLDDDFGLDTSRTSLTLFDLQTGQRAWTTRIPFPPNQTNQPSLVAVSLDSTGIIHLYVLHSILFVGELNLSGVMHQPLTPVLPVIQANQIHDTALDDEDRLYIRWDGILKRIHTSRGTEYSFRYQLAGTNSSQVAPDGEGGAYIWEQGSGLRPHQLYHVFADGTIQGPTSLYAANENQSYGELKYCPSAHLLFQVEADFAQGFRLYLVWLHPDSLVVLSRRLEYASVPIFSNYYFTSSDSVFRIRFSSTPVCRLLQVNTSDSTWSTLDTLREEWFPYPYYEDDPYWQAIINRSDLSIFWGNNGVTRHGTSRLHSVAPSTNSGSKIQIRVHDQSLSIYSPIFFDRIKLYNLLGQYITEAQMSSPVSRYQFKLGRNLAQGSYLILILNQDHYSGSRIVSLVR